MPVYTYTTIDVPLAVNTTLFGINDAGARMFPVRCLWSLLRWEGQCMGAAGEPRKRPHCLMCFEYGGRLKLQNHERSLPRVLDSNYESQRHRHAYRWGGIMSKRSLVIEEGSVEAMARLQKQDEEFCRRLRAAIETGREYCPTTVFTKPCTNRPATPSSDA
jgi:hypothetical protein